MGFQGAGARLAVGSASLLLCALGIVGASQWVFAGTEAGKLPSNGGNYILLQPDSPTSRPAGLPQDTISHTYDNPPAGCQPSDHDVASVAIRNPNYFGNIGTPMPPTKPNLVAAGTTVEVFGTAEHQSRAADCSVTLAKLPHSWKLTYEDPGGVISDATATLSGTLSLTPSFVAANLGTYRLELTAGGAGSVPQTVTLTVSVVASGILWTNIGPAGFGYLDSGRVNAIAFDPRPGFFGTAYIGTPAGGVWKATDGGSNWRPVMDNKGMPTLAVGALAVASDGTVYAATGDPNKLDSRAGQGIYRSQDGGISWTPVGGPGVSCGLSGGNIRRILADPGDPATIYAAGDAGLCRSGDRGATWTMIQGAAGTVYDLAFDPSDAQHLYAVTPGGVWSTRAARANPPNWTQLGGPACPSPNRGALAVSGASAQIVYASFVCPQTEVPFFFVQVYRSSDQGASWTPLPRPGWVSQSSYNHSLIVDPTDANIVFLGDVTLWRFDALNRNPEYCPGGAGPCWVEWNGPGGNGPGGGTPGANGYDIHGDVHALAFAPGPGWRLLAGTDGGVYAWDEGLVAAQWMRLNYNLTLGQFYTIAVNPNAGWDLAGGLQDNATVRRQRPGSAWSAPPGASGDGYWAAYDARVPGIGDPAPWATWLNTIYYNQNWGNDDGTTPWWEGDLMYRFNRYVSNQQTSLGLIPAPRADPFRAGVMVSPSSSAWGVAANQLYYASNIDTASSAPNWACIDPTVTAGGGQVTEVAFPRLFPSGSDGVYYVATNSGQVFLVAALSPVPPGVICGFGTAAYPPQRIYASASATPITGLAVDPARPCVVYALEPAAIAQDPRLRIVQMTGTAAAGTCTAPWILTGIAGQPADPGGFPTQVYTQPIAIQNRAIAVDPSVANTIHVGTDAGLFTGRFDGTNWNWRRILDLPDTKVTDIKAHVNAGGSSGALYAATFGRGAYERVFVGRTEAAVGQDIRSQAATNAIDRCHVREHQAPGIHWRMAEVEVDYTYTGDHGDNVWLRPVVTVDGAASPHFIHEVRHAATVSGTAHLQVIYGSADAPLGLATNGLRVEMFVQGGASFLSSECHFAKTWRRDNARVLEVLAEDIAEEGGHGQAVVPITVTLPHGAVESHTTPFSLFVTQGDSVTLQAPATRGHLDETRLLVHWLSPGQGLRSDSPSLTLAVSGDTSAVVRYSRLERRAFLPALFKSWRD